MVSQFVKGLKGSAGDDVVIGCRWGLNERRLDRLRRGELAGRAFVNALHRKGADRRQGAHEHHGRFADVAFLGRRLVADIILHEQ